MKSFIKAIMLAILIMAVAFIMPGFMDDTRYTQAADEAEWSEENDDNTEADAFTILEIVPYKGMAEIGYLIGGQEPINPELISLENFGGALIAGDAYNLYPSYREKPLPTDQSADSGWRVSMHYVKQNGYFEYQSNSGPDLYRISEGNTIYEAVPMGTGDYVARLPQNATLENTYENIWNPVVHRKNVVAYFSHSSFGNDNLFSNTIRYKPYSVTRSDDNTGDYDYDSANKIFYLNIGQGAYDVLFVPSGSGSYFMRNDYVIVDDNSGDYSYGGNLTYTPSTGGNYIRVTNVPVFTYEQWWGGNYRWVQSDEALTKPSNYYREGNRIWIKGYKVLQNYQFTYVGEIVNNEWFKRVSLGIPSEHVNDYPVRVVTITPNELNRPENQHYIDEASLIYINENYNHNVSYIRLYETYSDEGINLPSGDRYHNNDGKKQAELNFAVNDLSWESVERLFKRIAGIGCHKAAVILDSTFYNKAISGQGAYSQLRANVNVGVGYTGQSATSCNVAKLFIMIYQRNMIDFYNAFMNPDRSDYLIQSNSVSPGINRSGTTGSYVRPGASYGAGSNQALYWNGNTFLAIGLNEDGELVSYGNNLSEADFRRYGIFNYNLMATPTDVSDNVLIIGGSDIFTDKFMNPLYIPQDAQNDAVEHFNSLDPDNPVNPGSITLGDLLNVITNNGEGFDNTGGVAYPDGGDVEGPGDGEDPGTGDDPGGSNIRTYKRVLNIQPTADFEGSQAAIEAILSDYDVRIVNMTSTQFNGYIADINSNYDMIFMGSGSGRFNMQNSQHKVTTFNANNYPERGNIYFVEGDIISSQSGGSYRYRGNDISEDKKAKLEEYLRAGYPIILDANLYRMRDSRNNVSVRTDTNMYRFIVDSKANFSGNFLNMGDYESGGNLRTTFNNRLNSALRIIRPNISLIQPLLPANPKIYYSYVDPTTGILNIKFKLLPKGTNPSYHTYNVQVYLDANGDGAFDPSEEVQMVSGDGSTWENISESENRIFSCSINMSAYNGVRQWKLVVRRNDNELIRGYVTGYAANSNPETISILQIIDNDSTYNIESSIIYDEDSLLRTYTRSDNLKDYTLEFTTMTVQDFELLYVNHSYDSTNPTGTSKLSEYNLILMDNPSTAISNTNGAVTNIREEISNRGLPVVFTKDALGYNNQQDYFGYNGYSFQSNTSYTYNYINRIAKNGEDFIYSNMRGDFGTNLRSDNAYLSVYLTKTNEGSITRYPYQIGNAIRIAQTKYSDWAVDNYSESKKLIGWYCLADSGDPTVAEEGLAGSSPINTHMGTYSSSPNDVVSNYYLFNNGPCFYSGIVLSEADIAGNDDEMKLFVNTLIAAYKASDRVVSRPPRIDIIDPVPVPDPEEEDRPTIIVSPEDIVEGNLVVTFELSRSSSAMDLRVKLDDVEEPEGDWDDIIYPSVYGVLGDPILINNSNKVLSNNTYGLLIPTDILMGTHKLTLQALNEDGNTVTENVWIKFINPPVVTVIKPIAEENSKSKYIYVDIDYNDLVDDGHNMNQAAWLDIIFKVEAAITDVYLRLESGDELLPTDSYEIYEYDGVITSGPLDLGNTHSGNSEYALRLPMSFMTNRNIREFKIIAEDLNGQAGSDTFTLLRRSLFPLD